MELIWTEPPLNIVPGREGRKAQLRTVNSGAKRVSVVHILIKKTKWFLVSMQDGHPERADS